MKPIELAIEGAGSLTELARRLKVSPQVVANWKRRGVPARMVLAVEKASGVSRHRLSPALYPRERAAA